MSYSNFLCRKYVMPFFGGPFVLLYSVFKPSHRNFIAKFYFCVHVSMSFPRPNEESCTDQNKICRFF